MRPYQNRGSYLAYVLMVGLFTIALLSSCSTGAKPDTTSTKDVQAGSEYQAILATTEILKGPNRIVFGIYRSEADQLQDAAVSAVFRPAEKSDQKTENGDGTGPEKKSDLKYIGGNYAGKGLYLASIDLDRTGDWIAELSIEKDEETFKKEVGLMVVDKGATPAIGAPAPLSDNFVLEGASQDKDTYYCSAVPPCSMHEASIKDAINEGKPLVILFATPGRCVSELCGPQLEVTETLKQEVGSKAEFIHIEVFPDPESEDINPIVYEWGLPTEPWTFLVDKDGKVFAKFEGPVLKEELRRSLDIMLEKS